MGDRNTPQRHDPVPSPEDARARPELVGVHPSYPVDCPHCDQVDVVTPVTEDLRVRVRGEQWARHYPRAVREQRAAHLGVHVVVVVSDGTAA